MFNRTFKSSFKEDKTRLRVLISDVYTALTYSVKGADNLDIVKSERLAHKPGCVEVTRSATRIPTAELFAKSGLACNRCLPEYAALYTDANITFNLARDLYIIIGSKKPDAAILSTCFERILVKRTTFKSADPASEIVDTFYAEVLQILLRITASFTDPLDANLRTSAYAFCPRLEMLPDSETAIALQLKGLYWLMLSPITFADLVCCVQLPVEHASRILPSHAVRVPDSLGTETDAAALQNFTSTVSTFIKDGLTLKEAIPTAVALV